MNIYIKKSRWSNKIILLKKSTVRFTILFLLIIFLNIFALEIKNSFYFISSPISKYFWQTGNRFLFISEVFLNAKSFKDENDHLKKENKKLLSEIFLIQESLRENQDLQKIIKDKKINNFKIVLGKTIGLDTASDFILINKGEDDGILENMPVISSQKVLYGKISKVYKNFSQVMLISNKNSTLNVKISREESIDLEQNIDLVQKPTYGVVKGNGALSIYLDLVNHDTVIKENDILITSGLEGIFPVNLLIGKIKSINQSDLKPFQTAEIQSFFNVRDIENIFIITNYKIQ